MYGYLRIVYFSVRIKHLQDVTRIIAFFLLGLSKRKGTFLPKTHSLQSDTLTLHQFITCAVVHFLLISHLPIFLQLLSYNLAYVHGTAFYDCMLNCSCAPEVETQLKRKRSTEKKPTIITTIFCAFRDFAITL